MKKKPKWWFDYNGETRKLSLKGSLFLGEKPQWPFWKLTAGS